MILVIQKLRLTLSTNNLEENLKLQPMSMISEINLLCLMMPKGVRDVNSMHGPCNYKWKSFDDRMSFLMSILRLVRLGTSNAWAMAELTIKKIIKTNTERSSTT